MSGPEQSPLFSKTLRIESKTIFVDVKENSNGTYLKIAERSTRGDRSTVVMAVSGIQELRDALDEALAIQNAQPQMPVATESCTLFVSSVSVTCDEQAIMAHFAQAGEVVSVTVQRMANGASQGRALVTFSQPYMANYAKNTLDNSTLNGEIVRCREDRKAGKASKLDEPKIVNEHRVYVTNLSWRTTKSDLTKHFETIGLVTECDVKTTKGGTKSLGAGYVEFMEARCAQIAINQLSGTELDGRTIVVREYYM